MNNRLIAIKRKFKSGLRYLLAVLSQLPQNISAIILEFRIKVLKQKVVFKDRFEFRFWLSSQDNVFWHKKNKTITDSISVICFLLETVKEGDICIDIGVARGGVSVPLWSRCGYSGKVVSVEADPTKIDGIKANLTLNGFPTEYVVNAAVSNKVETRPFRCFPAAPGWNTFGDPPFARKHKSYVVNVDCIDFTHLLRSQAIDKFVDFVKIDIEGAELLALKGMLPYLRGKHVGCVVFEVNPLMLPGLGTTVDELLSFWNDLPYDLYQLTDEGHLLPLNDSWPEGRVGDCVAYLNEYKR